MRDNCCTFSSSGVVVVEEESLSFFAVATMEAAFSARNVEMNSFIVML